MSQDLTKQALSQIDSVLDDYANTRTRSEYDDLSDLPSGQQQIIFRGAASIQRIAGSGSQYAKMIDSHIKGYKSTDVWQALPAVIGAVTALRRDVENGFMLGVEELIHANVFSDFLDMARYLLEEGYKDPAAVLVGGVLEGHLRSLCAKYSIPSDLPKSGGGIQPKKAEMMNQDLVQANAYSKLDQKNVTAWLDLRNKAAHGHYTDYTKEQVELMLQSVQDFVSRNPA